MLFFIYIYRLYGSNQSIAVGVKQGVHLKARRRLGGRQLNINADCIGKQHLQKLVEYFYDHESYEILDGTITRFCSILQRFQFFLLDFPETAVRQLIFISFYDDIIIMKMIKAVLLVLAFMLFAAEATHINHQINPNLLKSLVSDRRLKTDIEFLFKSPSGINVYSFKYIDDPSTTYQGVMAQDLIGTEFEGAVIHGERYMAVNYAVIDVAFKKIENLASA